MKKFLILIFCFFITTTLCSCSNSNNKQTTNAENLNYKVCAELSNIDGVENLNDETIKLLSIIIRTNISNNFESHESFSNSNLSDKQKEKIESLVFYTSNLILSNDMTKKQKIGYFLSENQNKSWKIQIPKHKILSFAAKHNISLANLSDINVLSDDEERVTEFIIGGKSFDFQTIKSEFSLPSDKITNISVSKTTIEIEGYFCGYSNDLDINKINQLANQNKNFSEILKEISLDNKITVINF